MKLKRVKQQFHLLWPANMVHVTGSHCRGLPGHVVDVDHPLEKGYDVKTDRLDGAGMKVWKHVKGWVEGQEHKFEDLHEDDAPKAHPIDNAQAMVEMREWKMKEASEPPPKKPKTVRKAKKKNTEDAPTPAMDVPTPEDEL